MKVCDINPHIRFASHMSYNSEHKTVFIKDCRLFYVLSGKGEIIIENQHYDFEKNTLFYCRAGSVYSIESKTGMEIISINFDLSQAYNQRCFSYQRYDASMKDKIIVEDCNTEGSAFLNSYRIWRGTNEICEMLEGICSEFFSQRLYFRERCSAMLKEVIIMLHRDDFAETENGAQMVDTVIDYIGQNFARRLDNKELAILVGYHEYHLNRVFVKHMGVSLHRYIILRRLDEAKKLLINSSLSLNEIAEKVGFGNNTYFSCYFKKENGMTPSQYRKNFKNTI